MLAVKDQMHFCTFWMAKFVEGHFVLLLVLPTLDENDSLVGMLD